jgi:CBS domain-containing protein
MRDIRDLCKHEVVVAQRSTPLVEVAGSMRDRHVGAVVVVEERNGLRVPIGVITDRDLVVGVVARCEPYVEKLTAGDVLTRTAIVAREDDDVVRVAHRMRAENVRRMPIVDKYGGLVGMVSVDDVLAVLAEAIYALSEMGVRQPRREAKLRT